MQIHLPLDARNLMDRLLCDVDDRLGSNGIQELKVCIHKTWQFAACCSAECCVYMLPCAFMSGVSGGVWQCVTCSVAHLACLEIMTWGSACLQSNGALPMLASLDISYGFLSAKCSSTNYFCAADTLLLPWCRLGEPLQHSGPAYAHCQASS